MEVIRDSANVYTVLTLRGPMRVEFTDVCAARVEWECQVQIDSKWVPYLEGTCPANHDRWAVVRKAAADSLRILRKRSFTVTSAGVSRQAV